MLMNTQNSVVRLAVAMATELPHAGTAGLSGTECKKKPKNTSAVLPGSVLVQTNSVSKTLNLIRLDQRTFIHLYVGQSLAGLDWVTGTVPQTHQRAGLHLKTKSPSSGKKSFTGGVPQGSLLGPHTLWDGADVASSPN